MSSRTACSLASAPGGAAVARPTSAAAARCPSRRRWTTPAVSSSTRTQRREGQLGWRRRRRRLRQRLRARREPVLEDSGNVCGCYCPVKRSQFAEAAGCLIGGVHGPRHTVGETETMPVPGEYSVNTRSRRRTTHVSSSTKKSGTVSCTSIPSR